MSEVPFQLLVNCDYPQAKQETLICTAVLRDVPAKRRVCLASWNEREVIVKLFMHKIKARRHIKKEWQGAGLLEKRGFNTPSPLFYGKTEQGQWVIALEKIEDSQTVLDAFNEMTNKSDKLDLLITLSRELAKQHIKGVFQKDLHLGNFLLKGDQLFTLDPAEIRFSQSEISKNKSLSQIALLARNLPEDDKESIENLCHEYALARNWQLVQSDMVLLEKLLALQRKKDVKMGRKKCMRTSKRYLKVKTDGFIALFRKDFLKNSDPMDLIRQLDSLMDAGNILKKGNTCYVSRINYNNTDVVVKRYNNKGLVHSLRHTLKRSRARRGWLHAHRLGGLGIITPEPFAFIERYKAGLIWNSYILTEYIHGQNLDYFLKNENITKHQKAQLVQAVIEIVDKLGKYRLSHGDLKHTNILVTDNGPVLTDLDAMTAHKFNFMYNRRKAKDMQRLMSSDIRDLIA